MSLARFVSYLHFLLRVGTRQYLLPQKKLDNLLVPFEIALLNPIVVYSTSFYLVGGEAGAIGVVSSYRSSRNCCLQ